MKRFRVEYDVYAVDKEMLEGILENSESIPTVFTVTEVPEQPEPGWYQRMQGLNYEIGGPVKKFSATDIREYLEDYDLFTFQYMYRRVNEPTPYTGVLGGL